MRKGAMLVAWLVAVTTIVGPGYAQRTWCPTVMTMNGMAPAAWVV